MSSCRRRSAVPSRIVIRHTSWWGSGAVVYARMARSAQSAAHAVTPSVWSAVAEGLERNPVIALPHAEAVARSAARAQRQRGLPVALDDELERRRGAVQHAVLATGGIGVQPGDRVREVGVDAAAHRRAGAREAELAAPRPRLDVR